MDQEQETPEGVAAPTLGPSPAIYSVHYQKLVSTGNYENERVGAWAAVPVGQTPEQALEELKGWVGDQLGQHEEVAQLQTDLVRLRGEKARLESMVASAHANYDKVKAFFDRLGLPMPGPYLPDDDMPW